MNLRTYFASVSPTYIENWAPALYEQSIPHVGVKLTLDEVRALGGRVRRYGRAFGFGPGAPVPRVFAELSAALTRFPDGAFVRLGSRSAKDSSYALTRGLRVVDAESAIRILTSESRRVAFDLDVALKNDYEAFIFVREWQDIPDWAEFRCFMRDRKLVGISQYDCTNLGHCPEISKYREPIRKAIEGFFPTFRDACHLADVVFDIYLSSGGFEATQPPFEVRLLEINPFITETDACLFEWSNTRGFDGSFRFL